MKKILQDIVAVARDAVSIMLEAKAIEGTKESKTGHANFVTAYDKRVQDFLFTRLKDVIPDAVFIGEEEDTHKKLPEGYAFIIDPIDGTTNFMMGYNCSCISIALLKAGEPVIGVIYNPYANEVCTAIKGQGAYLNDEPIHVRDESIENSIVMVGTAPYYEELFETSFKKIYKVFNHCIDIRRSGSAAIDLCAVATGRVGLYFEQELCPWDYAAGALIVTEAGGEFVHIDGSKIQYEEKRGAVAGSKRAVKEYFEIVGQVENNSEFIKELEYAKLDRLYKEMVKYYAADPARIQHFVKVHSFAALIGRSEGLDLKTQLILEAAAYVHDIGIKPALEKYGSSDGKYQEELGPDVAEVMLTNLGFEKDAIGRIKYLVSHHHTYNAIDGIDYQILVEADFLVNLYEDYCVCADSSNNDSSSANYNANPILNRSKDAANNAYERIFKTATGRELCKDMFL